MRKESGECERGSRKEGGRGCGKRKILIVGVGGMGEKNATSPGTCPEVRWGFHPIQKYLYTGFFGWCAGSLRPISCPCMSKDSSFSFTKTGSLRKEFFF
jgi:hypothetical protein